MVRDLGRKYLLILVLLLAPVLAVASPVSGNNIHFHNLSSSTNSTGFNQDVELNVTVASQEEPSSVNVTVTRPDGTESVHEMSLTGTGATDHRNYEYVFSDTWQPGEYDYRVEAATSDNSETSSTGSFTVEVNSSMNVVTSKNRYGAQEEVKLTRPRDVSRNASEIFNTVTRKRFERDLFSESSTTLQGSSSGSHTYTHDLNEGQTHDHTESDGGLFGTDFSEVWYNYSTSYGTLNNITVKMTGVATGGGMDIQIRNYDTNSWETAFTLSSTSTVDLQDTICSSEAGCAPYISSSGDIDIRGFASSAGTSAEDTFTIDYLTVEVETDEGQVLEEEDVSQPSIGEDEDFKKRYYSKFNFTDLPINRSAQIQSAELHFSVSSGSGTGEIYHTKNFSSSDAASTIYNDGLPAESGQTNPLSTFTTSAGTKTVDVTGAVSDTFNSGRRWVGFQFREQGQDQLYTLGATRYLTINYTAESEIVNTGENDMDGYVVMRVQEFEGGSWSNVGLPVVGQTAGTYTVEADSELNLSKIWNNNGGFNTEDREAGSYRVFSRFTDDNGNTLENSDGSPISDIFEFRIFAPLVNLTAVEHENQVDHSLNEYGVGDTIDNVNTTIEVKKTTAVNASVSLEVLNRNLQPVPWGPDDTRSCGDVAEGESCERSFTNSSQGYKIPRSAIPEGSRTMTWNVTMQANNFPGRINTTETFTLHYTPSNFSAEINDSDNKIIRNQSALYNFTISNPWSQPLDHVNVTASCKGNQLACDELGGGDRKIELGSIASGAEVNATYNVTSGPSTDTGLYDLNATVEYVNPGGERKEWEQQQNRVLTVRIEGALTKIINAPDNVTRGEQGYFFNSSTTNTFDNSLTGVNSTWALPSQWTNSSGNQTKLRDTLAPDETFTHNFTAGVGNSAGLGPREVRVDVTNDQLREDSALVTVDVYANTSLAIAFNDTDPAVGDAVRITGTLTWDNGTLIPNEELNFTDTTSDELLGTEITDNSGQASVVHTPERPLGSHSIETIYDGSDIIYANPSTQSGTLTVHKIPNITDVTAEPDPVGFGYNVTVNATVTDLDDGVSSVDLEIKYPNGTDLNTAMQNVYGSVYQYNFSETWTEGTYDFSIRAEDNAGKINTSNSSFEVGVDQTSSIGTRKFDYFPGDNVTLTNSSYPWSLRNYDFRRQVNVTENSGNDLEKFPSRVVLSNLGGKIDSGCNEIRMAENGTVKDMYVESCNPSGDTVIWAPTNVTASSTEGELFAYYNNTGSGAADAPDELYAYPISDTGTYDPGATSITNSHEYNGGDAVFRHIELTFFEANGNTMSVTVQARNISSGNLVTIYDQTGVADGTTVLDEVYYRRPWYTEVQISASSEASGGGFDPKGDVSYTYNFTTPGLTSTDTQEEEDRFTSIIENVGNTPFKGRVILEVFSNVSGSWSSIETIHNDTSPRSLSAGGQVELFELWNPDPFSTARETPGFYRAVFKLVDPSGNILTDSGDIRRESDFELNPSESNISIENIEFYNVTNAGNQRTDTSDLEDSGANTTFRLIGGETYRVEVEIQNQPDASAAWQVDDSNILKYINIHPDWTVDTANDVFYSNGTDTFTGGSRETAATSSNVTWTPQGGLVKPGNSANFSFIAQIPDENEAERDVEFSINDIGFLETDDSNIKVYSSAAQKPNANVFELNDTEVERGDPFRAYANWSTDIQTAVAEYNSTSGTLTNHTVTPESTWTNYTTSTNSSWLRGVHTFRFYVTDFVGNSNDTRKLKFDVNGLASIKDTELNQTEAEVGNPVRFACRVVSDQDTAIQNYQVNFYNETSQVTTASTSANGWANITYSSQSIGLQDLTCNITDDDSRHYTANVSEGTEQLRVIETEPPKYHQVGQNSSRVFKTTKNDTVKLFANWTDNHQLGAAFLATNESGSFVNSSAHDPIDLAGTQAWSNFTVDIPAPAPLVDMGWRIWANDTSSNYNVTDTGIVEIWAFTTILETDSEASQNPVTEDETFRFRCRVKQGNSSDVKNLPVTFYTNSSGSMQQVGVNATVSNGFASLEFNHTEPTAVKTRCSIQRNDTRHLQPFTPDRGNYTEVVKVLNRPTLPPYVVDGTYEVNDTAAFKPNAIKTSAQWNESISWAKAEFNWTGNDFIDQKISGPFTNNWTNYTLSVNRSWDVGTHLVKTYANDTDGNFNDTLNYLKFDVWGRSNVTWQSPTGEVSKGETKLKCRVADNQTGAPIENYTVGFYDDGSNLIDTNDTRSDGTAVVFYNTTELEDGEKTWSCRIGNEPDLYYNTSNQDSDSETVTLLNQTDGILAMNFTEPPNLTTVAQNRTFDANVSIECRESDCGDVNATLRYNQTGSAPDTFMSETQDTPFYTIGANPQDCMTGMEVNDTCFVSWEVNATGAQDSHYAIDVLAEGTTAKVNNSADRRLTIDVVLIFNLNYSDIEFPQSAPSTSDPNFVEGPGNTPGNYFGELDENSNNADGGVWIKMTNLNHSGAVNPSYRQIPPENTTWTLKPSCSYAASVKIHEGYSQMKSFLGSGDNFTNCFFQEIPQGKAAGVYKGKMAIKVNTTG